LSQQEIGVFVRAALPGTLRIAEVQLIEERAVPHDAMDASRVYKIREEMRATWYSQNFP
jgi:hypothetical protein